MKTNQKIEKVEILSKKELNDIQGGKFDAISSELKAVQMGNSSCCNVVVNPKK